MASVHVAHDCIVGNNVIMSNLTTLGGHVNIDDWAILSGGVLVHQFCNISKHAFIGAGALVTQDVPPFILAAGSPIEYSGINSCLLYTSPSPRDAHESRMPSSA